jgi:predicted nuclease of predicted toxin-antitoxin system
MHLVADESVEAYISAALIEAGHNVLEISEHAPGLSDQDVLEFALERGEILLTNDKDFGDLVHAKGRKHKGVILMRLSGMNPRDKCARIVMVIGTHTEELQNSFTTIRKKRVRIRPRQ